ncbi:MAG: hypothetical protein GEV09_20245 [Pseudonocardiaceae bacterium]|nr:hypothetical protein [Pseudonocardiaceae bacterium]
MTSPDPEEQDGRSGSARPGRDGTDPDGTDAAFEDIVAGWRAEQDAPRWPAEADAEPAPSREGTRSGPDRGGAVPAEEHFVPPEPPPMPALRPRTVGGLLLIGIGVLLLFAPGVPGLTERIGTPLGLLALAGGIAWLVLGLRSGPPTDSGWDDGAQL